MTDFDFIPKEWGPFFWFAVFVVLVVAGGLGAVFTWLTNYTNKLAKASEDKDERDRVSRETMEREMIEALKTQNALIGSNTERLREGMMEINERYHECNQRCTEVIAKNGLFFERNERVLQDLVDILEKRGQE